MLTKPLHGWTDFNMDGTSTYSLSYLDDIAFDWLDQAIHGLETLSPFCVKGFLEPSRLLCTVSLWNCHIIIEEDDRYPLENGDIVNKYSHTSMLDFCKQLHTDVSNNIDEWVSFVDYGQEQDMEYKKQTLLEKLSQLESLICNSEEYFGQNRCFL